MIRIYFCLILVLLLSNYGLNAQVDSSEQLLFKKIFLAAEKEYGINQELINGPLYENESQNINGNPYLLSYYTNQGGVVYRGKPYSNLNLRYDIYNQQLLLIYLFDNLEYKLHLQKEFITEFSIENRKFIHEAFGGDGDAKFYQVIGNNFPIKMLYFLQKGLSNEYANNPDIKMFSPEQKETFILRNNELLGFKGNNSFIRQFSSQSKATIKKYLRNKNLKIKQAKDYEMELLIEFINNIEN